VFAGAGFVVAVDAPGSAGRLAAAALETFDLGERDACSTSDANSSSWFTCTNVPLDATTVRASVHWTPRLEPVKFVQGPPSNSPPFTDVDRDDAGDGDGDDDGDDEDEDHDDRDDDGELLVVADEPFADSRPERKVARAKRSRSNSG
jgi:hypothetical protein